MRLSVAAVLVFVTLSLVACGGGSSSSGSGSASGSGNPPPQSISGAMATVNFGTPHQTIRGFGGADAWINLNGTTEANALFGTASGQIGLSILRVRIDPSSTTAGSQWDPEVANAKAAIAAGSNVSIIATPWTPPVAWKINIPDPTNPVAEGSLDPNHYGDFANYLESFVTYTANNGVNLYAISMQNEPDANVTYESCSWTPAQMDSWVAQNAGVLTTKFMMPESEGFNTFFSDPTLNDSSAVGNVSIVAGHIYGTSPSYYANAVNKGKEVWMTEHYLTPVGNSQPAIADALAAALEIHNSLTVGQYNAYVWWWVGEWSGNPNYGLVDTNNSPTYYGWAMAQFARFIRPGYVRTDVRSSTPSVYVSAYSGAGHSVIVAINMNSSAVNQPFTIQNQALTSLVPYQTTASSSVAQQSAVSVSGGQFTYTLPAQSITTFVQ